MNLDEFLSQPVMQLGASVFTLRHVLAFGAGLFVLLLLLLATALWRQSAARALAQAQMAERAREADAAPADPAPGAGPDAPPA